MRRIRFVPGNIAFGNPITIPDTAPDIEEVYEAEITRILDSVVVAHGAGANIAHAEGLPVGHAGMALDPHAITQPNPHTMSATSPPIPGGAVTMPDGGQMEVVGGPFVDDGNTMDAHAGMAVAIHAITQPDPHPAVDIVAALANHAVAAGLINHAASGVTVAQAASPTRVDRRTITLDVTTNLGDLLTLAYHEVGERILAS